MSWITKNLRAHKKHVLDLHFLMNHKTQRYHNLYNKFYIGFMSIEESKALLNLTEEYPSEQRVVVALEKKHSDEIVLTYYIQKTRKNLYLYSFDNGTLSKEKKDPYGITVTEVYHINKVMDESYKLDMSNIKVIKKLLRSEFEKKDKH